MCKWRKRASHPGHTRDPDTCRFPLVESVDYKCPGCKKSLPFGEGGENGHTFIPGECRAVEDEVRFRGSYGRRGKAPREPSRPAASSGSADAQAQLSNGNDLGQLDEEAAEAAEAEVKAVEPEMKIEPDATTEDALENNEGNQGDTRQIVRGRRAARRTVKSETHGPRSTGT